MQHFHKSCLNLFSSLSWSLPPTPTNTHLKGGWEVSSFTSKQLDSWLIYQTYIFFFELKKQLLIKKQKQQKYVSSFKPWHHPCLSVISNIRTGLFTGFIQQPTFIHRTLDCTSVRLAERLQESEQWLREQISWLQYLWTQSFNCCDSLLFYNGVKLNVYISSFPFIH